MSSTVRAKQEVDTMKKEQGPQIKRKSFTIEQILALECQFVLTKYLRGQQRIQLAKKLNLTDAQVKVWFQNRRAKRSKQKSEKTALSEFEDSMPVKVDETMSQKYKAD